MTNTTAAVTPPRSLYIVGGLSLVWNLIGVATYLMSVTMSEAALTAMPDAERALYTDIPAWSTSAYAIAVFGGTVASGLLLMRKAVSVPLFLVSLLAIVVQMAYGLFGTALLEVKGGSAVVMPVVVAAVAVYLWWYAKGAKAKGWLG